MAHSRGKRWIALIAAYALALQAFVSAFASLPLDLASHAGTLCLSQNTDDGNSAPPLSHEPCLGCLTGQCQAALGYDVAVNHIDWAIRAERIATPLPHDSPQPAPRARHLARAPPAA
jgi:hypothetical protein